MSLLWALGPPLLSGLAGLALKSRWPLAPELAVALGLWGSVAGVYGIPGFSRHIEYLAWAAPLLLIPAYAPRLVLVFLVTLQVIQGGVGWIFPVLCGVLGILSVPQRLEASTVTARLETAGLAGITMLACITEFRSASVGLVAMGAGLGGAISGSGTPVRLALALLGLLGACYGSSNDLSLALLLVLLGTGFSRPGMVAALALLWEASDLKNL